MHPNNERPAASSLSFPSKTAKRKRSTSSTSSASSSPTDKHTAAADNNKKKRKTSSTAPRTLTKEELADYIARDEFWQRTEAAKGEGGGYKYGRGDEQNSADPVHDDCNETRRNITALRKTGRMTQAALGKRWEWAATRTSAS